ncbi:MAG TPA: glycosyltransferase family 4 protein [Ktedonobacteraceae bacterium]|nr:glycosyltransferase family 4 protein [Ktedonobacteraceae bacterium]
MEDRMRICFVTFTFSPLVGGSEARAEKQARQLQAFGHDVTIVTFRHYRQWKRNEMLDGLPVVRVGGIYRRNGRLNIGRLGHLPNIIMMFLTLWRLRRSFDVIHALQLSPPAALIGQLTRKPVILGIQSAGPSETQRTQLERGAMLMADTLTETSFLKVDLKDWESGAGDIGHLPRLPLGKTMLDFLRKSNAFYQILSTRSHSYLTSHGFRAGQIVHIPGSVDTQRFQPALERRPAPASPERDIICVARLDLAKGVDVLLHAWGRMLREPSAWRAHLKPRLRLVGKGVCRAQMERIVAELGIQDSVELLGLRTDIVDLLQQSWGFVMPSRWEGMPNALLEAMACGLPCVATRVSGSEDIIADGVNGLLVEPEQPAEMARALRRIIEDTELAQRLGQEGRATVVRDYQLATIVEQCLQLYRSRLTGESNVMPLALEGGGN